MYVLHPKSTEMFKSVGHPTVTATSPNEIEFNGKKYPYPNKDFTLKPFQIGRMGRTDY